MTTTAASDAARASRGDAGVEANRRLTAATGAVVLVALAVEGLTVPWAREWLWLHAFVGVMLIPLVLLKIGSTGYRFVKYYARNAAYRRGGPPHPVLRVAGPFVTVLSVAVVATGTVLLLGGSSYRNPWKDLHTASFIAWFVVMTVHVLGHVVETIRVAPRDWQRDPPERIAHVGIRRAAVIVSLVAGIGLGVTIQGQVRSWTREHSAERKRHGD